MSLQAPGSPVALPGHQAPSAGFEAPFDLLSACHDRVRRSLQLLDRLRRHVAEAGADRAAREAAADVLRYFDLAAPHHHADEELHLFPRLRAEGDATLGAAVDRLAADHAAMAQAWAALRAPLQALADQGTADLPALDAAATGFAGLYAGHLKLEDEVVFPAAQRLFDAAGLQAMGEDMARRRGARTAPASPRDAEPGRAAEAE